LIERVLRFEGESAQLYTLLSAGIRIFGLCFVAEATPPQALCQRNAPLYKHCIYAAFIEMQFFSMTALLLRKLTFRDGYNFDGRRGRPGRILGPSLIESRESLATLANADEFELVR
jgi:hypothetical protein